MADPETNLTAGRTGTRKSLASLLKVGTPPMRLATLIDDD